MKTVLEEINKLRNCNTCDFEKENTNRYCLIAKEQIGRTAYCFSAPIYSSSSNRLVSREFKQTGQAYYFDGGNSRITIINNCIVFKNELGSVSVKVALDNYSLGNDGLSNNKSSIKPTLNGVMVTVNEPRINLKVRVDRGMTNINYNSKFFAVVNEWPRPLFVVSALYGNNKNDQLIPVCLSNKQIGPQEFIVSIAAEDCLSLHFEMNMYEYKLFQDTTVETARPDENNAYGTIAFIGKTKENGEQWLYTRPDFAKITEFCTTRIYKAVLHIPCIKAGYSPPLIYSPKTRYCNLGSNWNNKIDYEKAHVDTVANKNYLSIDLFDHIISTEKHLRYIEGLIIVPRRYNEDNTFVLSTADSHAYPSILELRYC